MIPVQILGVHLEQSSGTPILLLGESEQATRVLPIFIGPAEAQAIIVALRQLTPPRPATHDLMIDVIGAMGANLQEVDVTELREGTFIAELVLDTPGGQERISGRPSDAIALAARTGVPIYVNPAVFDDAGVQLERAEEGDEEPADVEEVVADFQKFLDTATPSDFAQGTDMPGPPEPEDSSEDAESAEDE